MRDLIINEHNIIKDVLLIGAGDTAQTILRQTLQKSNMSIRIVGFLDDDLQKVGTRIHNVEVIGTVSDLNKFDILYEEIYICVPTANRNQLRIIVD